MSMKILFTPKVAKTQNGSTEGRVNGRAGIIFFFRRNDEFEVIKNKTKGPKWCHLLSPMSPTQDLVTD